MGTRYSIHRLWVHVRTASRCGSNEYPQSMFWNTLVTLDLPIVKVGLHGVNFRGHVILIEMFLFFFTASAVEL